MVPGGVWIVEERNFDQEYKLAVISMSELKGQDVGLYFLSENLAPIT